jgi:hypothetical protein
VWSPCSTLVCSRALRHDRQSGRPAALHTGYHILPSALRYAPFFSRANCSMKVSGGLLSSCGCVIWLEVAYWIWWCENCELHQLWLIVFSLHTVLLYMLLFLFMIMYITFVSGKLSSEQGLLFYLKEQPKWPFTFSLGGYAADAFTILISLLI